MDFFSGQQSWQLPPQEGTGVSSGSERPLSADWLKSGASMSPNGDGSSTTYGHAQNGNAQMDLTDSFGELPNPVSAPSSLQAPTSYQSLYWQPPAYQTTPYYNSYTPYQLPVSSYSSLNGATSSTPDTQPPLVIDPALTAGSPSTHNSNGSGLYSFHVQQQPSQPQILPGNQPVPSYTINPSALLNHQPLQAAITNAATTTPISRAPPKANLRDVLKPLLTPSKLTGSSAVGIIVKLLEQYGVSNIAADVRADLFTKMAMQADDQFFKAWVDNPAAIDITRDWLKAGTVEKSDGPLRTTVNPILSALGRMRFSVEGLKDAKLGRLVVKLTKDLNSTTRDLSLELEKRWRNLVNGMESSPIIVRREESDEKVKKRKLSEGVTSNAAPPAKKLALASTSTVKAVPKKEPKVVVTSVKDVKSDSSFFSKPKTKLPSFKKSTTLANAATTTAPMKESVNVAQPSSFDPFQNILKEMKRHASPKVELQPTPPTGSSTTPLSLKTKKSGPKKTVTFAAEGQLEQIKFIERAIYDDDPTDINIHGLHTIRELDRGEGAAMHLHLMEEQMDWTDPLPLDLSETVQAELTTEEGPAQDAREANALVAIYMNSEQIPDSPAELLQPPSADPDANIKIMVLGAAFGDVQMAATPGTGTNSISQLLGQMSSTTDSNALLASLTQLAGGNQANAGFSALPDELGLLVSQLANSNPALANNAMDWSTGLSGNIFPSQERQEYDGQNPPWGSYGSDNDRGGARGRGRGRGRGRPPQGAGPRRPCSFFLQGRCRFGDQCDYSHDQSIL